MIFSQPLNLSRFALLALGLSTVWLTGPLVGRAEAGMIIQVVAGDTVTAGGTGAFDVLLSNDDASREVSGFSFELSVADGSGVEFTGVTAEPLLAPYIFGTPQEPPLSLDDFPTVRFTASDSLWTAPGYVSLDPNQTVGLARVSFAVAANAPGGSVPIMFTVGDVTMILDALGEPIDLLTYPGAIIVTPAAAVPEPSSLALLAIAGASLAGWGRLRRKAG